MLAEIFMLRLEATARGGQGAAITQEHLSVHPHHVAAGEGVLKTALTFKVFSASRCIVQSHSLPQLPGTVFLYAFDLIEPER